MFLLLGDNRFSLGDEHRLLKNRGGANHMPRICECARSSVRRLSGSLETGLARKASLLSFFCFHGQVDGRPRV